MPRGLQKDRWRMRSMSLAAVAMACGLAGCVDTVIPNLRGSVVDAVTREPIAHASVDVYGRDGVEEHVLTDSRGFFALKGGTQGRALPHPRSVPKLRLRVSAACYDSYEVVDYFPAFNSIRPPTLLPTELSPTCPQPPAGRS